jgi:hypothetical protein
MQRWLGWLWPWGRRRLRHWEVVLLTRAGCHLCDEAWDMLDRLQGRYGFVLRPQDVDADPELVRKHGERVPVVLVNGKERFWGRINPVLLRRHFQAGSE